MKPVPHGEPYAGKLHVRFDEGAGVPDNKGRPALLYTPLYYCDALYVDADRFYLVEFKTGGPENFDLHRKIYDSVIAFIEHGVLSKLSLIDFDRFAENRNWCN